MSLSFPVKTYPYRVYYADTDAGGVVYYAQYLRMFEQARALYVEDYELSLAEMEQKNCLFVCRRVEIDYHSPARLDDRLSIHTQITELSKTSIFFAYTITCPDHSGTESHETTIVTGVTRMVASKQKESRIVPIRIPDWILEKLSQSKEEKTLTESPLTGSHHGLSMI